ncbi:abortive phage infection protein, partial [Chroococcidiopsis sp. CCALA 051]|uniref:AIPR family protein n=1 Tax=Chroococcidiopsis sp. CCALA 051 TaxID=869949 RepID=UPI000D0CED73
MVLQLRQVKNQLTRTLTQLIDLSDMSNKSQDDREKIRLSRSYAAYSLISLASVETNIALDAIVDGYKDNGIDAIFYDEDENILWLAQAKWINSGKGEPDTGEVNKFVRGIRHLIDLEFSRFNEKINNKKTQIERALDNPNLKIKIILAYSGTQLGSDNKTLIQEFIEENNVVSELCFFEIFSLTEAHQALSKSLTQSIDKDFTLIHWGQNEEPYQTIYGQISAEDLANLWQEHQEKLFSKNIRSFIGLSDVNEGIQDTLSNSPESFLYFNNGITVLCDKIQKLPRGGADKSVATFRCEKISIVNGAQTVGTIGNCYDRNSEQVRKAKVFIKLISLENCPSDFALRVTKATNTQNKVENRDFISLDPFQDQLKVEFALDGIDYHYKRSSHTYQLDDKNCTVEEAAIALACGSEEIRYALMAKDKIGKLWEDVNKPPYTDLFNDRVKAQQIWRMIRISRALDTKLSELSSSYTDKK